MIDSLSILTIPCENEEDYIEHHGVLGMKWGQRKEKARLAGMSMRQYKKQIKADNKMAFKLGKEATIADRLLEYTNKKSNKIINKAFKKNTRKSDLDMARAYTNKAKAEKRAKEARAAIKQHHAALVKKYGGVNVSNIKKDKKGRINERMTNHKSHVINAGLSALGTLAGSILIPGSALYVQTPMSKKQIVRNEYKRMNLQTDREVRYKR